MNYVNTQRSRIHVKETLKEIKIIDNWIIILSLLLLVSIWFKQTLIDLKQKIMEKENKMQKLRNRLKHSGTTSYY